MNSLRDLWDNKRSNICIISIQGEKDKWSEARRVFTEIMAENFPNLVKVKLYSYLRSCTNSQIRINSKKPTPKLESMVKYHSMVTKLLKTKDKKIWKQSEKWHIICRGNQFEWQWISHLKPWSLKKIAQYFLSVERKELSPANSIKFYIQQKYPSEMIGK